MPSSGTPIGVEAKAKGASQCKPTILTKKDEVPDICELSEAIRMYPASEDTLKETGVPNNLQVHQEQSTMHAGASVYLCWHEICSATGYFTQNPSLLYSHIRRKHLGICFACPYCSNKLYWNSCGWHNHMEAHHKLVPHYGHALADKAREVQKALTVQETKPQVLEVPESQPPTTKEVASDNLQDSSSDSSSLDTSTQEGR